MTSLFLDTPPAKRKRVISIQNDTYQENVTRTVAAPEPQTENTDSEYTIEYRRCHVTGVNEP